jgi:hypothetical protein
MNELLADAKTIILGLVAAGLSLLTFFGRRELKRLDTIEDQYVTRDELAKTLSLMRDDRMQMHRENREELRYIRERVDGIADRQ